MTAKSIIDKELYKSGGVVDRSLKNARLEITEKPFQHRAAEDTPCHDCGRFIGQGEPFISSAIECTQGVRGKSHRYAIHLACYDIVGRVVMILGKAATHGFDGRPPLSEMWKKNAKAIKSADPDLAKMLEGAFGK